MRSSTSSPGCPGHCAACTHRLRTRRFKTPFEPSLPAGLRAMLARDPPDEPHRAASSLELLFDLVFFVVAVSQTSGALHHLWEEHHFVTGLASYAMVFFAIFNAWKDFIWFASAYDTDDWLYRLTAFVQMGGAWSSPPGRRAPCWPTTSGGRSSRVTSSCGWRRRRSGSGRRSAIAHHAEHVCGMRSASWSCRCCGCPGMSSTARCGCSPRSRWWTCPCRRSPNGTGRRRTTTITSPSGTACSP